jgi:purine-binding chemotaxis protein CheW
VPAPRPARDDPRFAAGSDRYLTFVLGTEVYALSILDVTEIMEFRSPTRVPMMPPYVRGVLNLRGRGVPVVDLATRFGNGVTEVARRTSVIIVEVPGEDGAAGGRHLGIMVDAVNKVAHLTAEDIEPPPEFGAGIRADFISGMARHDGEFIIVLDVSRMLSVDEVSVLDRVATSAPATPAGDPSPSGRPSTSGASASASPPSAGPSSTGSAPADQAEADAAAAEAAFYDTGFEASGS